MCVSLWVQRAWRGQWGTSPLPIAAPQLCASIGIRACQTALACPAYGHGVEVVGRAMYPRDCLNEKQQHVSTLQRHTGTDNMGVQRHIVDERDS